MIPGVHPVLGGLLGTLVTWGLTALGAAFVFVLPKDMDQSLQQRVLDCCLGFAGGVMVAASFWSMLGPAIEVAENAGVYGSFVFLPVAIGFAVGGGFVAMMDSVMPHIDSSSFSEIELGRAKKDDDRRSDARGGEGASEAAWRRILLLVLAITIHNFPEGLAVGVAFGAIGSTASATYESAVKVTIGIGLQNFPEGLAVSLPLVRLGYSPMKAFWYGQLSGMVEPLGGMLGAAMVGLAEGLLPYALAFAAGAMIFVVVDDLIPEAHENGNRKLASAGFMVGFIVMMCMDVGLG